MYFQWYRFSLGDPMCGTSMLKRLVSRIFIYTTPRHLARNDQLLSHKLCHLPQVYCTKKNALQNRLRRGRGAHCVCWTSALVERKLTIAVPFSRLLHIAAHLLTSRAPVHRSEYTYAHLHELTALVYCQQWDTANATNIFPLRFSWTWCQSQIALIRSVPFQRLLSLWT